MKNTLLLILLSLIFSCQALSQSLLQGVVLYQNSGGQPVVGVEISAFGANSQTTNSNGMFILSFGAKNPGERVKIIIGGTDEKGTNIVVVNTRQLEIVRIPADPDESPLEIIVSPAAERDAAVLRYNGILESATNNEFQQRLNNLEKQLGQKNLDTATSASLLSQIDELKKERDTALEKVEEQAKFIASINKDRASDLVKEAIQKIEEEKDIESALQVLDNAKLEEAYQLAIEKKLRAENEIKQVIEGYELKISLLLPKFRYKEAVFCYKRIIEIHEANQFPEEALATYYGKIALVLYDDGQSLKALEFQQKDMAILEEILDPKHPGLAASYNNIALIYEALGKTQKALQFQKKSIAIYEEILDPKHPDLAISYNNIALTYKALGETQKALQFHQKAIAIREEILDPKHPSLATSYNNIALTHKALGETQKALEFLQKAIAIKEEILDPKHPDLAGSYNNIATIFNALGETQKALQFQQRVIAIAEEVLDPKHPHLATSYNNIATTYKALGETQKALQFQQKAIAIREEILDPKHPSLAVNYNNIAKTYMEKKDFPNALDFQKKAINIFKEALPKTHPYQQIAYNILLKIHSERGLDAFGKKEYEKALVDFDTLKMHINESYIWNYSGLCHYNLKNYTKAIEHYQEAAELDPQIKTVYFYNNIGMAYANYGQLDDAEQAFQENQKLFPNSGRTYRNWAMFYALKGDKEKALANLQKAIDLGYDDLDWITTDDSLESIRKGKAYLQIVEELEKNMAENQKE